MEEKYKINHDFHKFYKRFMVGFYIAGWRMNYNNLSDKEKGYLFGLFEGDGYKINDKKSRHYHVEFYLNSIKDKDIINFLLKLLKKIELNPRIYQDKRFNCKRIRVYSKEIFSIMEKKMDIKNESKSFKIGYVSGLIDSEGYVNKEKDYIEVINTNKIVLDNCKNFLDEIKINSSINERTLSKKDKQKSYGMYISVKFKNQPHLSIKVPRVLL